MPLLLRLAVCLCWASTGLGCDALRSPEHHLTRAEAHLARGEAQEALDIIERHGLLATAAGRQRGIEALVALDRPLEAIDLLGLAESESPAAQQQACRAALPVAALSADGPTRERVRAQCGADALPEHQDDLLRTAYALALHDRLPDHSTRRAHRAAAASDPALVAPLVALWEALGARLVLAEQRATALRMVWALDPRPERAPQLIDRIEREALAALETSPHEALSWFEHLSRPARLPDLPVPDEVRARAVEHIGAISKALATEGMIVDWERRRRAVDEAAGLWEESTRTFVFPPEPLDARDERLREWLADRAGWPTRAYGDLAPWRDEGLCADPATPCRIPLGTFARWGASFEELTDPGQAPMREPEER